MHSLISAEKYRPEIDGLRAIAVIAVILYHAKFMVHGIPVLAGGFVGVDIFFVISGYLITRIILTEIREGKFSYLNFYERRARRILPVLLAVMVTSIPLAYLYMFPKAMKEYSGSILAALAFNSNTWFMQQDSYWAEPSALKPFLHTWSLSVEEQFYFLFPIALLLLWKYARNHIKSLLILTLILSFALAHFISAHLTGPRFSNATFYLLPTRGWELLAGAILAKLELDSERINHPLLEAIMPAIGVFLIIVAVVFYNDTVRYPTFIILPILGTMLLIWYGKRGERVSNILGSKPFVSIGLISYGLYLWHFPIFAFSKIKQPINSQYDKMEWVLISLALAITTYFLIEKPARNVHKLQTRTFCITVSFLFACLLGTQLYFLKSGGAEFRFAAFNKIVDINYWAETGHKEMFRTHTGCWLSDETVDPHNPFKQRKSHETLSSKKLIMIIGDSHAAGLIPGLIKNFGRNNIVQRIVNGCRLGNKSARDFCHAGMKAAFTEINKINPDVIIIGGNYENDEHLIELKSLFDGELKSFRNKIVILGPLPRWQEGLPAKLQKIYGHYPFKIPHKLEPSPETFTLDHTLRKLSNQWGIAYLSPVETFCSNERCLVKVGEKPDEITAWDGAHFTHTASNFLIEKNISLIKKFLRP